MKRAIIVQARLGSIRLPHKILEDICGQSMLERVMSRCQHSAFANDTILAIPDTPPDNITLRAYAVARGWNIAMGPEDDVLQRYLLAAVAYGVQIIARVGGDCPLIHPDIIDLTFETQRISNADYVTSMTAFPEGLDVEVFTTQALNRLAALPLSPREREHVTTGFYVRRTLRFSVLQMVNLANPWQVHWSVDTPAALEHVRWLVQHVSPLSSWREILEVEKQWQQLSAGLERSADNGF